MPVSKAKKPVKLHRLEQKPALAAAMEKAAAAAQELRLKDPKMTDLRAVMKSKDMQQAFNEMIEFSAMSEPLKKYVRGVLIEKKTKRKALQKAFGRDLGYQEEALSAAIMNNPSVKDFVDLVKEFHKRMAPVAAMKEVEIMFDPKVDAKTRLDAAKDIQNRAGVVDQSNARSTVLPVTVQINMPQQINVNPSE